jgi:hypothetical protein
MAASALVQSGGAILCLSSFAGECVMNSLTVKISLVALAVAGGLALPASPAQAGPGLDRAVAAQMDPIAKNAAWGCGPYGCEGGWRRPFGGYGYPRPDYWGGGYGRRPHPYGGGYGWGGGWGPRW